VESQKVSFLNKPLISLVFFKYGSSFAGPAMLARCGAITAGELSAWDPLSRAIKVLARSVLEGVVVGTV
jgi:hypothetical protein